jgi:glycerol-3-phosphate dehydrogenase
MYDILAGKENMESSYWMGKGKALEAFPMLKSEGLVGGVVYYDGELLGLPPLLTAYCLLTKSQHNAIDQVNITTLE